MKYTIDDINNTITIEEIVSVEDALKLLQNFKGYSLIPNQVQNPFQPFQPYTPYTPSPLFPDQPVYSTVKT